MQFHAFAFNDTFLWKLENLNIEDMKKILVTILFVTSVMLSLAQTESVKPTLGLELDRKVSVAIIEEKTWYDVFVELKAGDWGGVKITIKNNMGKRIYKKRFPKSYLYAFSNGSIQIGKGNALTQVILYKSKESGMWLMEVRQGGIY